MASIADLIASGPGGSERRSAGSSTAPGRLGLPAGAISTTRGYTSDLGRGVGRGSGGGRQVTVPVSFGAGGGGGYTEEDALRVLSGMSPEKLARVQQQMKTAGLIGPETKFTIGSMDRTTRGAFGELLEISNLSSTSWDKTLADLGTRAASAGGGDTTAREELDKTRQELQQRRDEAIRGFGTSLNTYQRPDPAAVRSTAEAAFREALGRKPNAKELAVFTDRFIRSEMASQKTVFDAQDANQAADRTRTLQGFDAALGALDGGATGTASGDPVEALLRAVGSQESGNNYNARNGRTGASGKYQITPASWGPWSREAGLPAGAPRNAANQERVARFKMGQYVQQFGQQGAAVAWYAGPSAAKAWLKNSETSRFTRKQGRGNDPSINEYVQQVTARMANAGAGGARYGSPDKAAKTGRGNPDDPGFGSNLTTINFLGKKVQVHRNAAAAFQRLAGELAARGYRPKSVGGHNNRNIRGTSKKSEHAWGYAIDIDPDLNPEGGSRHALPKDISQIAAKYGLKWGGDFKSRSPDYMHFEYKGGGSHAGHGHGPAPTAAPLSASVTNQQQDAGAQAVEFARTANPIESKAFDIGGQFNNLISILGRSVI